MADKKYTVAEAGPRVEKFLNTVFKLAGFRLNYTVSEGETPHPDFENPDMLVRFSGADVELLLANKAELLLALEQLTMEALGMPAEEHSRVCFDANDCSSSSRFEDALESIARFDASRADRISLLSLGAR